MQAKLDGLERTVAALDATMKANHAQNRGDIHRLFNGQETLSNSIQAGLDKIADRIEHRCNGLDEDINGIKLKMAKATGYVAGVAGACALIFELIKFVIERWHG